MTTSDPNVVFTTVLGSCVAVCMYDPLVRVGGMNHFLLPDGGESSNDASDMRFGVHSMEILINELLKKGGRKSHLEAKLYGGASVIQSKKGEIGKSNADFAHSFLLRENIKCVDTNLGGKSARRLKFFATRGEVEHYLVPTKIDISEERNFPTASKLNAEVTLF